MNCFTPQIAWHNRDPVCSIDVQPSKINEFTYRIASGGVDSHVLIWRVTLDESSVKAKPDLLCVADLTRHERSVNAVRFSPCSEFLASGDDDANIIIWTRKDSGIETSEENWHTLKLLRVHVDDIYDIRWSPDSQFLISGSIDNSAVVTAIHTHEKHILSGHKNFVQGVCWDPANEFVSTLSTDGTMRVFSLVTKKLKGQFHKFECPTERMTFHDDKTKSYFRRLTFSPDGNFLFAPCGKIEKMKDKVVLDKPINGVFVFSRDSYAKPFMHLPSIGECAVVVSCCPVIFDLINPDSPLQERITTLPYRMVVAVALKSGVFLYDTEHVVPFAAVTNMHFLLPTDLSWSSDGRLLVVSSLDGYCSFIRFTDGELGKPYPKKVTMPRAPPPSSTKKKQQKLYKKVFKDAANPSDVSIEEKCTKNAAEPADVSIGKIPTDAKCS